MSMVDVESVRLGFTRWLNCNALSHVVVRREVVSVDGFVRTFKVKCYVCGEEVEEVVE